MKPRVQELLEKARAANECEQAASAEIVAAIRDGGDMTDFQSDDVKHLRQWAADIRASSGVSVDADRLDEIASNIEALRARVMNWQPIETAPKDGTVILVATFKMGTDIASAAWRGDFWDIHHLDSPADMYERYDREFGKPTHWMPLPPPPASTNEGKE